MGFPLREIDPSVLLGKVAVVTGAASGIGSATVGVLAAAGATVVIGDIDEDSARSLAARMCSSGARAVAMHLDVTREESAVGFFASVGELFGRIDVLHNNAGVLGGPRFPGSRADYWNRTIDVNLRGVLYGIQYGLELFGDAGGSIVNTASTAGLEPGPVDPVYAATKAAVVNLTRSLGFLKEERGIRVNCVCPGIVATDLSRHSGEFLDDADQADFHTARRAAGKYSTRALAPRDVAESVLDLVLGTQNAACLRVEAGETPILL